MDLTIHHARLDTTDQVVNVGISGGRIAALQADDLAPGRSAIEANGALVSPAFIDPHFHLENALLNDAVNTSGTLREAINIYADIKRNMTREDIVARATRALRMAVANGTLWMRNNVDIDQIAKLRLLDAICEARDEVRQCASTCRSLHSPNSACPGTLKRWT